MEPGHRDQTESSVILPAHTHHPVTFHCPTTPPPTPLKKKGVQFAQVSELQGAEGDSEKNCHHFALFTYCCFLICVLMHEGQCGALCIGEAEFSLTVLKRDVHSAVLMHRIQSHRSVLTHGCCPALSHWTAIADCL